MKFFIGLFLVYWALFMPTMLLIVFAEDIADLIRAKAEELRERAEKISKEKDNDAN